MFLRNLSIKAKLTTIITLVTTAVVCGGFTFVIFFEIRHFKADMIRAAENQARSLGKRWAPALADGRPGAAREAVLDAAQASGVVAACLFSEDGRRLACEGTPSSLPQTLPSVGSFAEFAGETLKVAQPVVHDGETRGVVYLEMSADHLKEIVRAYLLTMLALVVVLVFSAFVLSWLFEGVISRPISRLAGVVERIARTDDFSVRVEKVTDDETGRLYDGFNEMLEHIQQREVERDLAQAALRRSEDQFRQAQKMEAMGRLAGGVAHDFNNLLMAIAGYAELMLDKIEPGSRPEAHAKEIMRTTDRASALTRQLLAFSRKQMIDPQLVNLNEVVSDMGKMLRRVIGEDIELIILPGQDLGLCKVDQGQIEQVVMNLAVNARDAMPDGGHLTLETTNVDVDDQYASYFGGRAGSYVRLSITDTGVGMDAHVMAHLFEPFFTTKEKGKGTGLGLSTVYGIISRSAGYVQASSQPREGTAFQIFLPRVEEVAVEAVEAPVVAPGARAGETILLVEDDDGIRRLAYEMLTSRGYKVFERGRGAEAIEVAEQQSASIRLLITDVVMPGMNGRELADRLTSMIPGLPVIFMSGYTDDVVTVADVREQGKDFMQKPFTLASLAHRVREALDRSTAERDVSERPATR